MERCDDACDNGRQLELGHLRWPARDHERRPPQRRSRGKTLRHGCVCAAVNGAAVNGAAADGAAAGAIVQCTGHGAGGGIRSDVRAAIAGDVVVRSAAQHAFGAQGICTAGEHSTALVRIVGLGRGDLRPHERTAAQHAFGERAPGLRGGAAGGRSTAVV